MSQVNVAVSHYMCTVHDQNQLTVYFTNPFHPAVRFYLPSPPVVSCVCGLSSLLAFAMESMPNVVYFYDINSRYIKRRIRLRFDVVQLAITDNIVVVRTVFNFMVFSRTDYENLYVSITDSPVSVQNDTVSFSKKHTLFVLKTKPLQMFYRDFEFKIQSTFLSDDRTYCAVVDSSGRSIHLLNCHYNTEQVFRRGAEATTVHSVDFYENFMLCSSETGTIHLFKMNENKAKSQLKTTQKGQAWFSSVQGEIICVRGDGIGKLRYGKDGVQQISEWKWA